MLELRIHGFGGQGADTLAQLLATAALEAGCQSQALPYFGVERRGAPVKAAVRIAREGQIKLRSQSVEPDILVVLSEALWQQALSEGVADNYSLVINTSSDEPFYGREVWRIDATALAIEAALGSPEAPFINIPMLGAVCRVVDIPEDIMVRTLEKKWPGAVGEKNAQVALAAYHKVTKSGGAGLE